MKNTNNLTAAEKALLGTHDHPEHPGVNDWRITIIPHPVIGLIAQTNGDPVQQEGNEEAWEQLMESYGLAPDATNAAEVLNLTRKPCPWTDKLELLSFTVGGESMVDVPFLVGTTAEEVAADLASYRLREFLNGFARGADIDRGEACAQWAGYSSQLTDEARRLIEKDGEDAGFTEGQAFARFFANC